MLKHKQTWLSFCTLMLLLAGSFSSVTGQSSGSISLTEPDASAYPVISTTFTAIDPSGVFINDLKPRELRVTENNTTIPSYTLELERVGVRFYAAINEGPILRNRYSGVSHIDRIKTALFNWIATQPAENPNAFHLVVNQGATQMNATNPDQWKETLEGYQPDLMNATPGMVSLSTAVDDALNTTLEPQKSTAILFVTSPPTDSQLTGMQDIIARAKSNGIAVFIWLVGWQDYAGSPAAMQLEAFARETGGQYFLFSGAEELPVIADLLDPLGYLYHLAYTTKANVSGEYSLALNIQRGDLDLTSEAAAFTLSISPPNPIFLSPPSTITRNWTETKKKSDSVLTPETVTLMIMMEYPDGLPRELVNSRLFVDGGMVDENQKSPFDSFTWDISGDAESTVHNLQVIVEDSVGLKGQTIQLPVEVIVEEQPVSTTERIFEQLTVVNWIIAAVILLVVIFGMVLLIITLRKHAEKKEKTRATDPVTQQVRINGEYTLTPAQPEAKVKWPVIRGIGLAPARLVQKPAASPAVDYLPEIPLGNEEVLIGAERKKVDYVLVHSTVSPLHARIFKDADGNYRIADSGSAAGTWVNYAPVSTRGVQLEHGDLVQFGRVAYLFELHGAVPRRVKVLPYKED